MKMQVNNLESLNTICPYFTMFPLSFPLGVLNRIGIQPERAVVDPFCGRGTSLYAARLNGLPSIGIDSSKIATAITEAKTVEVSPEDIIVEANYILNNRKDSIKLPEGEFWELMYHREVLEKLCVFREEFLKDCSSPTRKALRGIILGALHGPIPKTKFSYFSNQSPRTYSPKPKYAVRFWKRKGITPPKVDILKIIVERAFKYYKNTPPAVPSIVINGDSRDANIFETFAGRLKTGVIITSPPYLGMSTYIADQWIRNWFLGGPDSVDYTTKNQIGFRNKSVFIEGLNKVWKNLELISDEKTVMVVRFGCLPSVYYPPAELLAESFYGTKWRISKIESAGVPKNAFRQANSFLQKKSEYKKEIDVWVRFTK